MSVGTLSLAALMLTPRSRHEPIEGGRVDPASARIFISYSRKDGPGLGPPAEQAAETRVLRLAGHRRAGRWAGLVEPDRGCDELEGTPAFRSRCHAGGVGKSCGAPRDPARPARGQDRLPRQRPGSRRAWKTAALVGPGLRTGPGRASHFTDARPARAEPAKARPHDGAGAAGRLRPAAVRIQCAEKAAP